MSQITFATIEQMQEILRQQAQPPDETLTTREAAAFLKLSTGKVLELSHAGVLPCVDVGSPIKAKFLYSRNALSAYVGGRRD